MALSGGGSRRRKAYRQSKIAKPHFDKAFSRFLARPEASEGKAKAFVKTLKKVRAALAEKNCSKAHNELIHLDSDMDAFKGRGRDSARRIVANANSLFARKCEWDADDDIYS